jgi:ribonuclease VapC
VFIDASALVAIILGETEQVLFTAAIEEAETALLTEFVLLETGLAVMNRLDLSAGAVHVEIRDILDKFGILSATLTSTMILGAFQAHERYGKGRGHPARLNMGDCLSYAAAKALGLPLLYKGDDFSKTDIASALSRL